MKKKNSDINVFLSLDLYVLDFSNIHYGNNNSNYKNFISPFFNLVDRINHIERIFFFYDSFYKKKTTKNC